MWIFWFNILMLNSYLATSMGSDDAGAGHLAELSKLAEKDPEFYNYLQENDKELLEFNLDDNQGEGASDISDDEMVSGIPDGSEDEEETVPALTMNELRKWQKALLEVIFLDHSLDWNLSDYGSIPCSNTLSERYESYWLPFALLHTPTTTQQTLRGVLMTLPVCPIYFHLIRYGLTPYPSI